jgi:biotin-(acetyl-CoA carboxylase) ligase
MVDIQQYLKEFLASAETKYPELVEPEEFANLLATLYANARLILSQTSFNRYVYEKAEVELFLNRRVEMTRHDVHVKGNPLGHYKIMLYEDEQSIIRYVEIEWIGRDGNIATIQKVFKINANPEPLPLGEIISTLQVI